MNKTIIIAGGEITNREFLVRRLCNRSDIIICADSGANYLSGLEIIPDFIVGDMDSIDTMPLEAFRRIGVKIIKFPPGKDSTDTALAVTLALSLPPRQIEIYGALGKRFDHSFANVALLGMDMPEGVTLKIVNEECEVFVVRSETTIQGEAGQIVSIFPFGTRALGVTLNGFAYKLTDACMEMSNPCGISNELLDDEGTIRVADGALLVVRYFTRQ